MKGLLRSFLINSFAIWATSKVVTGLSYAGDLKILLLAGVVLGLVNLFVRPIVKLITLPINLVTLGIFSWLINVFMLYLTALVIPGFEVVSFYFPGFAYQGFSIPAIAFSTFWAYTAASFSISFIASALGWFVG